MKRIIFKKEDLTQLPIPEVGYKTLAINLDGTLSYIDDLGDITPIIGTNSGGNTNFANTNLTFTGNRIHDLNGNSLTINQSSVTRFGISTTGHVLFNKGTLAPATNVVIGDGAGLSFNSGGTVIIGAEAGQQTTAAGNNTIIGYRAGKNTIQGSNTIIGADAGINISDVVQSQANVIIGNSSATTFNDGVNSGNLTKSDTSIFIGNNTVSGSNNNAVNEIVIGTLSNGKGANTTTIGRISNTSLARIYGRLETDLVITDPTLIDNSTLSVWLNGSVPTIKIKNNVGVSTNIPLQSTTNTITKTSGIFNRTITFDAPTSSDDITIFRTDVAITVVEVIAVSIGTTPSTTYQLKHSTDRDAAGSNLTTSAATTSKTTGDVATLSVVAIPADSWIWLETTAASGTGVTLTVDIRYTID